MCHRAIFFLKVIAIVTKIFFSFYLKHFSYFSAPLATIADGFPAFANAGRLGSTYTGKINTYDLLILGAG